MTHVGNITRTEEGVQYRGGTQIREHCIPYSTENPLAMAIFWKKKNHGRAEDNGHCFFK